MSNYEPVDGPDSFEVHGLFARGWPLPIGWLSWGKATAQDPHLRRYAVALQVGHWSEGSWIVDGACAAIASGQAAEARGGFLDAGFSQAVLGHRLVNIYHTGRLGQRCRKVTWNRPQLLRVAWQQFDSVRKSANARLGRGAGMCYAEAAKRISRML